MSLPNAITLSRIPLMFVIAWLTYQAWPWAPSLAFWLFIAAAIGDWLGRLPRLRRTRGQISAFGKLMDALTDKIMVLGLIIVFVDRQEIPVALALITLCREFLITGMRMVAATKGVVVAADGGGKSKTVTQLIAIGFLLAAPMVGRRLERATWALTDLTRLHPAGARHRLLDLLGGHGPRGLVGHAVRRPAPEDGVRRRRPMKLVQPVWPRFLSTPVVLAWATLGPIGRRLPAPGTWGSVAGLLYFTVAFLDQVGTLGNLCS